MSRWLPAKQEFIVGRDPGDESDGKIRWAVTTAETICKAAHPPTALKELAKEYRPDNWHVDHWIDHVYNQMLLSYQDRRLIDGLPEQKAAVCAYLDTVLYLVDRPDKPHLKDGRKVYRGEQ